MSLTHFAILFVLHTASSSVITRTRKFALSVVL